ncbi:hypothetical protein MBLNU13_g04501t3 [Cladosporium sp. NU13]
MASSSSNSTIYHRVQPASKPPHGTESCEVQELGNSTKASWRAPTTILLALFVGLGFALAHHSMGLSLNNKPVEQVELSQSWVSRFSTALAFLVKLALATSVGAAYTQHQWQKLRQQDFRTSEIDALISVLANASSFLSSTVWLKHPVLALMALVSCIPIAAIVAPGSLTVVPQSTNETVSLPVRQLDFNYTNFGSFVGGGSTGLLGDPRIYNLAFRTASTGETIELDSPGHYQNVSYHLDFRGPAVKFASAREELLYNLTYQYVVKSDTMIKYWFLSWTDAPLETPPNDEAIRFPDSWNVTRTYNGTDSWRYRQVNVTKCLLYNASYSVDYRFEYPSQSQYASVSDWLNPVVSLSNQEQRGDNLTVQGTLSYAAVMDAFTQVLVGEARKDEYPKERVTSTIQLFQNITLGLLSDDALINNGTLAELGPVTVNTWPVTYVCTASGLILAYGVAFLCALSCSAVGIYAFYVNNASYQNLFSTYIRTTVDSAIHLQTQSGDDGAHTLPKLWSNFTSCLAGIERIARSTTNEMTLKMLSYGD